MLQGDRMKTSIMAYIIAQEERDSYPQMYERARMLCIKEKEIRNNLSVYAVGGFPIPLEEGTRIPSECDDDFIPDLYIRKAKGRISEYLLDGKWLTLKQILAHPKMEVSKQAYFQKLSKGYTVEEAMKKGRKK